MNGVTYNKKRNIWEARISYRNKKYYLGSSIFQEEAAMMRRAAEYAKENDQFESFYSTLRTKLIM